ncbi:hypothetical protein SNOG_01380 [Parastagonospora nodorum SN15]|uniref:Uncharacterized protein n=2 Tax=Phaeosphaeria nodorum (strain SN15 / ATCC MYA-4574 / FGSC 10173) TaxID=321614 RepID=Q0V3N4_PHANO|nr:hypothetical protein SNOG_01380 [Parastagonospora nodorum SN15]EAT91029.2 hypothetical protein SNOG_01380 [Parastagonospora nodorum SN15]
MPIMSKVAARSGAAEFKAALDNVVSILPNEKTSKVGVTLKAARKLKQHKDLEIALRNTLDLQDMASWRVLIKYARV